MARDRKIGIGLLLFALLIYFVLIPMIPAQQWASDRTGLCPRSFPNLVAWIIAILSLWMIIFLPQYDEGCESIIERKFLIRSGITFAIVLIYLYGMNWIGFIPASIMALAVLMYHYGTRNKVALLANSIIAPIIIHIVFQKLFNVRFPQGIFF